ncbi:hypothetical protein GW17_00049575 [Ensete ventricosum]|nr:hypothetical protein GW17_00049575 [Ensete ventricosum]RZS22543.1 hypothetical protein BHM03_00055327 [Ensete ventricosum]
MRPQVEVSALPVSGRPYDRWGFGLTCAKSAARPLAPPYLRPTSFPHWVDHDVEEPNQTKVPFISDHEDG